MRLSRLRIITKVDDAIGSINKFVNTVKCYDYDIDIMSGRYIIDAKSLMGLFSLDLSSELTLKIHSDDCDEMINKLKQMGFIPEAGEPV